MRSEELREKVSLVCKCQETLMVCAQNEHLPYQQIIHKEGIPYTSKNYYLEREVLGKATARSQFPL